MRRRFMVSRLFMCVLVLPALLATNAYALTLTQTLARTSTRSSVVNAQTELRDAQANLKRVERDPLAVRTDTLQAEQRLALAKASLERARYAAAGDLTSAYTGVLGANAQVELARKSLDVSRRSLQVAKIRLENGSATRLDLDDAQASLDGAQNSLRAATDAQVLALDNFTSVAGEKVAAGDLTEISAAALPDLPPLDAALKSAERHPDLLSVKQQAALAQLGTDVLDPLYAAQAQIDTAESQRANAESASGDAQRNFRLQVRNLYAQAQNARATLRLNLSALENAQVRLRTQQQRLQGGLISQIEFDQAQLTTLQAELAAESAQSDYLNALLALQTGSLVPLGSPFSSSHLPTAAGRPA